MKRIRLTERVTGLTKDKVYEAILTDSDGDYVVISDLDDFIRVYSDQCEEIQFQPGKDSYCIRIHDERHYEFVWALLKDLGYRGHPAGWDAPYKPSYTWLALNDMDISPASKYLTHPFEVTYEITTDDLLQYTPDENTDELKEPAATKPQDPVTPEEFEQVIEALSEANDAMNYLGDILNNHDMILAKDEEAVNPTFKKVRAVLSKYKSDADDQS